MLSSFLFHAEYSFLLCFKKAHAPNHITGDCFSITSSIVENNLYELPSGAFIIIIRGIGYCNLVSENAADVANLLLPCSPSRVASRQGVRPLCLSYPLKLETILLKVTQIMVHLITVTTLWYLDKQ